MEQHSNQHGNGSSLSSLVMVFAFVCVYQAAILCAVMAWHGWHQA